VFFDYYMERISKLLILVDLIFYFLLECSDFD